MGIQYSVLVYNPNNLLPQIYEHNIEELMKKFNIRFYFLKTLHELHIKLNQIQEKRHAILVCDTKEEQTVIEQLKEIAQNCFWTIGVCKDKEEFNDWGNLVDMFVFEYKHLLEKIVILLYGRTQTDLMTDEERTEFDSFAKQYYPKYNIKPSNMNVTEYFKSLGVA